MDVYAEVRVRSARNTPGYWVDKLVKAFLHKELAVNGIDGVLTVLYNRIFWVFFTKPALLIYPFIAATGLGLFLYTVQQETYPLLNLGGKWYLGLLGLLMANVVTVAVHECAHAFTTKHFRRKVRRGGVMMYFGSPAVFIDTMDIWMEPKKSRIAVSWAGPYSGLLLGSLAIFAIAATGFADTTANNLVFKLALWAFVFGALTNLNPLLEWDGYFMLMDWLEIPMLRKRSMEFVRRNLLNRIVTRAPFSREEKIFGVFGVMAMVYSVFAIAVALFFWQSRVSDAFDKLRDLSDWLPWLLIGLAILIIGVPLAFALGVLGYKVVRGMSRWVYVHYLMGRPANQVAALGVGAYVMALPALFLGADSSEVYGAVAGGLVLAIGILSAIRLAPWYLRSELQWFFLALPWLLEIILVGRLLAPFQDSDNSASNVMGLGIGPVALLVSLVYLYPTLNSFRGTVLQGGWALLASGTAMVAMGALVAVLAGGEVSEVYVNAVSVLGYSLAAAGTFRLYDCLRRLHVERESEAVSEVLSDTERLSSAIRFLVERTLEQFVNTHGRRALRGLEKRFNATSVKGLSLTNGRLTDLGAGNLLERSQAYGEALSSLFSAKSRLGTRRFVERQLRGLYRLMPWEEREIGDEYLFSRMGLMGDVHRAETTAAEGQLNLLRSAALFAGLGEEDLKVISDRMRPERHAKATDVVTQGEAGTTFYLIESGTVEVWVRAEDGSETMEVELGKGDYFGERALLADAPRAATCRCSTEVQVLALDRDDFDLLVARRFGVAEALNEAIQRAELLMGMPLFSEVRAPQVKLLAAKLNSESFSAGTGIIRQGDSGDKFYLVKSGTVEIRRHAEGAEEESVVGRLGPGEYFGEIALLMDVPRTASVTAQTDVELLSLDAASFDEMVSDYLQSSRSLEQVSTRRMIQLRRSESLGYRVTA